MKKPTYNELKNQVNELQKQIDFLVQNTKTSCLNSDNNYKLLFENSVDGFAYCKMIFENNDPTDFIYLEVNPAFEKLTGLKNVTGKKVTDLIPGIKEKNPELFKLYGTAALTGKPDKFDIYFEPLNIWLCISVISRERGYFMAIFDDITERKKAEMALIDSEKQLRQITDNLPVLINQLNNETQYLYVNNEYSEVFGLPKQTFVGKNVEELIGKDAFERMKPYTQKVLRGEIAKFENTILNKNNKEINLQITFVPEIKNNKVTGFYALCFDITELKNKEKALKESEAKYRLLFENMPNGFSVHKVITDEKNNPVDFTFIEANRYFKDFSGLDNNEIIGKTVTEIQPGADLKMVQKYGNVGLTGIPFSMEYFSNTFNKYIKVNCYSPDKGIFAAIYEDITERKDAEQTLKESEERWEFALDGAEDGVWDWNIQTNEVFFSTQWKLQLGYNDNEIENNLDEWEKRVHPDDLKNCHKNIQLHIDNKTSHYLCIHRLLCKNGDYKWILDRGKIIKRDENNNPIRMIGTHTDMTERILMENQLLQLNADKDRFISILAHDLRSPFNGILGLIDLLKNNFKEYDTETINLQLSMIQKSANHAFNLLNDLLSWAVSKSSKQIFNPVQINFYEICEEVKDNIQELSKAKNIEVKNLVNKDILVTADADMLKTIIRNIISNAVKFTNTDGNIEIFAVQINKEILITIKDNGIGISKQRLQKLFSIDEINSTKGTNGEKGSGLGLLLCKEFVEKHGGKIWAESTPGEGSDFKFTLPNNEN